MPIRLALVLGLVWAVFPVFPGHAYLDPGTGSMIIQILLGGIAGAAVVLKLYWHKFKMMFSRQKPDITDGDAN